MAGMLSMDKMAANLENIAQDLGSTEQRKQRDAWGRIADAIKAISTALDVELPTGKYTLKKDYIAKALENIADADIGGDIRISDYIWPYYLTGKLEIPNTTAKVGKYMCGGFTSVSELAIPDSVTEIDDGAFTSLGYNNNSAGIILHAKKVVSIGSGAFSNALGLKSITLEACKMLGGSAFSGCTGVTSVSLPVCESLGNAAMSQCQMTSIKLPEIKTIGANTFGGCTQLEYIYLGANCTSIGQNAFGGAPITCKVECGFSEGAIEGFPANGGWAGDVSNLDITYDVAEPSE